MYSSSSESDSEEEEEEEEDADDDVVGSEVVSSTVNEEELPPEISTSRPSWLYRRSKTPTPPPGENPKREFKDVVTCLFTIGAVYWVWVFFLLFLCDKH